jgi:hypothetical protein
MNSERTSNTKTKETIKKRDIWNKEDNPRYERGVEQDVENLRKKKQTEILEIKSSLNQTKNTVEGHSSRLEQVEDRLLRFEDKIDIKEKIKNT